MAECTQATEEDVDSAAGETWKAFKTWKKIPISERVAILNRIADVVDANTKHLAMVESLDNGKPAHETMVIDTPLSTKHFRYSVGCIMVEEGSVNTLDEQFLSLALRELIGVIGQIVPWNFLFLMTAWRLAPVLAVGCCTVFKPSNDTPLSVLGSARLVQDVIPKGVFSVITGSESKSGQYMLDHERLRKLAFTNSTEVGCQVAPAAADRFIPATLELGERSANILFPGYNWEQAINGLQPGILFSQGQVCCADSRVSAHEDVYDKLLEDTVKAFNNVKVGVSWDPKTQMGSQINKRQPGKILSYVGIRKQEDTCLIYGGERITDGGLARGCFMHPILLADVTDDIRVAQEEAFGPVVYIPKLRDEDEVIHMTNDNTYNLGDAVWTHSLNHAVRAPRGIKTGRMWVNTYNQIPEESPFGGYEGSSISRETHKVILKHYTQMKNIMADLSEAPSGFYPVKRNLISAQ